jgi:hypothetical protein
MKKLRGTRYEIAQAVLLIEKKRERRKKFFFFSFNSNSGISVRSRPNKLIVCLLAMISIQGERGTKGQQSTL